MKCSQLLDPSGNLGFRFFHHSQWRPFGREGRSSREKWSRIFWGTPSRAHRLLRSLGSSS